MSTPNTKLQINWLYISIVVVISSAALGFIAWGITTQLYREWSQGLPISGGWNWPLVIAVDSVCATALCALFWKIYCDANTEIGIDTLSQPSIFGRRIINWSEVTDIQVFNGVGYHILAHSKKIVVAPYAYMNPDTVITMLHDRVEDARSKASYAD
jgi:hypothetical protein